MQKDLAYILAVSFGLYEDQSTSILISLNTRSGLQTLHCKHQSSAHRCSFS